MGCPLQISTGRGVTKDSTVLLCAQSCPRRFGLGHCSSGTVWLNSWHSSSRDSTLFACACASQLASFVTWRASTECQQDPVPRVGLALVLLRTQGPRRQGPRACWILFYSSADRMCSPASFLSSPMFARDRPHPKILDTHQQEFPWAHTGSSPSSLPSHSWQPPAPVCAPPVGAKPATPPPLWQALPPLALLPLPCPQQALPLAVWPPLQHLGTCGRPCPRPPTSAWEWTLGI